MATLTKKEIGPGLSVHLKPEIIVTFTDSESNVDPARAVYRNGYFLILEKHDDTRWLCVPLYSHKDGQPDRVELVKDDKDGHRGWKDPDSFYSTRQFWIISEDALVDASKGSEFAPRGQRNSYALKDLTLLDSIIAHKDDENSYQHIPKLPTPT